MAARRQGGGRFCPAHVTILRFLVRPRPKQRHCALYVPAACRNVQRSPLLLHDGDMYVEGAYREDEIENEAKGKKKSGECIHGHASAPK